MEVERREGPLFSFSLCFLPCLGHESRPWPPNFGKNVHPLAGPRGQKQPAASHQVLTGVVTNTEPAGWGVWPQPHCLPVWAGAGTIHLGEGSHTLAPSSSPSAPPSGFRSTRHSRPFTGLPPCAAPSPVLPSRGGGWGGMCFPPVLTYLSQSSS